ncbi:outer envelope protein 61-like [Zingiber officinale]|uniref:Outer envelope protein 61 n=1 Tax=Zingiber officinale TaxID=94328 RepID=A0A8J5LA98_ZINOF|nr:outer envelope protein 61-like [Zingiber officinale]KAG6511124.1 hypothetical protein ZIOFF_029179 [Zingiber officinale]
MYNGMMDPELMRLAQEQMSRLPPEELAKIQRQMMSNPELLKMATETMKNMKPEDVRQAAEQMRNRRTEDMVKVSERLASATPEEIASMKSFADAQVSYELSAAKMLKQQGNELHSQGQYNDAAEKYLHAKNTLKSISSSMARTLDLQCSLNLMSCYLKTNKFEDCIKEGSEVLTHDSRNVKALYRRGQSYKELGNLKAAVSDLRKAYELSPNDETIADVLRDANDKLIQAGGNTNMRRGVVIEEIVEEENQGILSDSHRNTPAEYSVTPPVEVVEFSESNGQASRDDSADGFLKSFSDDPENIRLFQNYLSTSDPSTLKAMGLQGISPEMIKSATDTINKMKPEELQKMFEVASSFKGKGPGDLKLGSELPEMTPEMVKMASETVSKMSPEELQRMMKVASSFNASSAPSQVADASTRGTENMAQSNTGSSSRTHSDVGERNSDDALLRSKMGQSSSDIPTSVASLQDNMQNSMRDPAMRQMFATMMKNMDPETMANMSQQFGINLSKEDAAKAQQAMSQLSASDLDKMMRWMEKAQRGIETAKRTKNWLLGRPGMILAIVMLILAFILHQLGFIGG